MQRKPRLATQSLVLFCLLCLCSVPQLTGQTSSRTLQATLTASPNPSFYEGNIDLFLSLGPTGPTPPTGTVEFYFDGVDVGGQPVFNYVAEQLLTVPKYSIGSHTVMAVYSGDTNFDPASATITHDIIKLRSQMQLLDLTTTIFYGQILDAVGNVRAVDTAPDATLNGGNYIFLLDGNEICRLTYGVSYTCPDSAGAGIDAGAHVLVGIYSGNEYFQRSQSPDGHFTVLPDDTTMTLKTSQTPTGFGQSVTFSVNMVATYAPPSGSVVFYDGGTAIGSGTLVPTGASVAPFNCGPLAPCSSNAAFSTSTLAVGTHSITARYVATQNFNASNAGPITQVVVPASSTTTLVTSSANPSALGQSVTFTASVSTAGMPVQIPSGSVTFLDGTAVLGTATLDQTGTARFTTSSLALGQHPITVSYAGTPVFAASVSSVLLQNVGTSVPANGSGFVITVSPASFAIGVGNYVSLNLSVVPLNGFNEPVQLSCASAPAEMNCLFDSVLIPAGGGTTRLTINPTAPHDCGSNTPYFVSRNTKAALFPLLLGFASLLFGRRRRWLKGLALAGLLALLPTLSGCGHCTDLGVKPGNYTFSVQGSSTGSAAITRSAAVKMTVHL